MSYAERKFEILVDQTFSESFRIHSESGEQLFLQSSIEPSAHGFYSCSVCQVELDFVSLTSHIQEKHLKDANIVMSCYNFACHLCNFFTPYKRNFICHLVSESHLVRHEQAEIRDILKKIVFKRTTSGEKKNSEETKDDKSATTATEAPKEEKAAEKGKQDGQVTSESQAESIALETPAGIPPKPTVVVPQRMLPMTPPKKRPENQLLSQQLEAESAAEAAAAAQALIQQNTAEIEQLQQIVEAGQNVQVVEQQVVQVEQQPHLDIIETVVTEEVVMDVPHIIGLAEVEVNKDAPVPQLVEEEVITEIITEQLVPMGVEEVLQHKEEVKEEKLDDEPPAKMPRLHALQPVIMSTEGVDDPVTHIIMPTMIQEEVEVQNGTQVQHVEEDVTPMMVGAVSHQALLNSAIPATVVQSTMVQQPVAQPTIVQQPVLQPVVVRSQVPLAQATGAAQPPQTVSNAARQSMMAAPKRREFHGIVNVYDFDVYGVTQRRIMIDLPPGADNEPASTESDFSCKECNTMYRRSTEQFLAHALEKHRVYRETPFVLHCTACKYTCCKEFYEHFRSHMLDPFHREFLGEKKIRLLLRYLEGTVKSKEDANMM